MYLCLGKGSNKNKIGVKTPSFTPPGGFSTLLSSYSEIRLRVPSPLRSDQSADLQPPLLRMDEAYEEQIVAPSWKTLACVSLAR